MVWHDPELQPLIQAAQKVLHKYYKIELTAIILVCTRNELVYEVFKEYEDIIMSNLQQKIFEKAIQDIEGRYFASSNEIWLVDQIGTNLETIIHEYLHSIQKCSPSREGIVYYVTYQLTNKQSQIDEYILTNWLEIEKEQGLKAIFKRILDIGDCEEFN